MAFNGRIPGVNMSEFMNTLNTVPAQEQPEVDPTFEFTDANLDLFTNTSFFDFDQGNNNLDTNFNFGSSASAGNTAPEDKNLEFMGGNFDFSGYNDFSQPTAYQAQVAPIQTAQPIYPQSSGLTSPQDGADSPQTGDKRKASAIAESPFPQTYESEDARVAAEEDKRRRNTAASARFRVKKKQREQALEKSAKEMADKVSALENRITQLETENKWLKSLVIEKKDNKSADDLAELYKKFTEDSERKGAERKDGVGTVKVDA